MMDPYNNQRDTRKQLNSRGNSAYQTQSASGVSGKDQTPEDVSGNPQAADRQPQHCDVFTMFPPNESRRNKIKMMAQKEEEDLQQWRDTHRPPPVHLTEKLGGNTTMAEAREKQQTDLRFSKLKKKMEKEALDKRRRQEDEEKLQEVKDKQREKAERQAERSRQEQQRRSEQLGQDHHRTNESFLQTIERRFPGPSSSASHTSSTSEAAASKQREKVPKSEREVAQDHKRVNSHFLDKLEGRCTGNEKEKEKERVQEAERPCLTTEAFRQQTTAGQQEPLVHLEPDPEQSWTEEADPEPDYDWALMKLMSRFPDCSKGFLEDILDQCNGDYEEANTLLFCTST
ncbi:epithelial-stromal interaction protein 1 [Brachyistius frenatus]|uniref:epithelial-stromal interaction protein 1 n=1 Tax=Brachyistius frenatus TaxID=100188 RepID=UPI0037E82AE2